MRSAVISVVRNEADILAQWMEHHCMLVDHMHIVLHDCTDASEDIAKALQQQGLPITLSTHGEYAHTQHEILTDLLHRYASDTQWIFPLDADEFIPLGSRTELEAVLRNTTHDRVSLLPWKTYVPTGTGATLSLRKKKEDRQFSKVLIPSALVRGTSARIEPGSHAVSGIAGEAHPSLFLAHLPVRSEKQIRQKATEGSARLAANPQRLAGEGTHWDTLNAQLETMPPPLTQQQLTALALTYACGDDVTPEVTEDPIALRQWVRGTAAAYSL